MSKEIVGPDDIRQAAVICLERLSPYVDRNWETKASGLDWTCHHTLDHTIGALMRYAGHLAMRSPVRRPGIREITPTQPPGDLLSTLETGAAVLAEVCRAAPEDARGFHSYGNSDRSGFAGMACTEILVHTDDIHRAFDPARQHLQVDPALCQRVLDRLFPWAPADYDAWETLLWATGRLSLPAVEDVANGWKWRGAPVAEWNE